MKKLGREEAEPEPQHDQRNDGDQRRRIECIDEPVGRGFLPSR